MRIRSLQLGLHSAVCTALLTALLPLGRVHAAAPPVEQLLPNDTLILFTVPDCTRLREVQKQSAQLQLWNDPSMKPFREHFLKKWNEEVVEPLQKDLGIQFKDYQGLAQGQLTLALLQNDWQAGSQEEPGTLFILDAKDHSGQLSTNLSDLRRKWVDAGKPLRTENIRGVEFSIVQLSTNDLPKTLRKFLPGLSDVKELGDDSGEKTDEKKSELFIGQSGSLLIVADSAKTAQKVMNRLTGGSLPALAEVNQFSTDQGRFFRHADIYGWINAKALMSMLEKTLSLKAENRDANAPDPFAQIKPSEIIAGTGLGGLQSGAFAYQDTPEGGLATLHLGVPESQRQGIFQILAGEPKETMPPPFVPADVVQFQRWRLDGKKTYDSILQMLQKVSPGAVGFWNYLLQTANQAAQAKDPNFDLQQQLVGNLGDDFITYQKVPRGTSPENLATPPTLFLLGCRDGEQFVSALKVLMTLMSRGGPPPADREFLGTTIHTFTLPNRAQMTNPEAPPNKLNVAVSRGYVAMTTDDAILEEFLRSADNPVKPLRQVAGLPEAMEKVSSPGTSLFSFEDQRALMRFQLEALRQASTNDTEELQSGMTPIPESLGVGMPRKSLTDWFDFSLLPPFEKIEKYFYHTAYGAGGSVDGLTLKIFSPTPPQLRGDSGSD